MTRNKEKSPREDRFSRGSEWRKWDLHIHSPMSALNNQYPRLANGQPDWNKYIKKLESLTEFSVVGITDYFTVEGYRKVLEFRKKGQLKNFSIVLPNIELRLDKFVGTRDGNKRLNYHVLFSNELMPEEIEEHFLQELKFKFQGDPQRTDLSLSVRRSNLELLGRQLKKEHKDFDDGRTDFEIGCLNATVDPGKIKEVLTNKERIFKGKYLVVLAEEHLSLLNWDSQDHLTRKILLQGADAIFSANPVSIKWARGEGDLSPEQFCSEFKTLKPALHGSDAHSLEKMGLPNENRFCWIKAEATFEGLKQVLYEPRERIFIGDRPERLKHPYQLIESIQVENAPTWFDNRVIPLNQDMVSVIGPRGSGKSALAEILAFAGGAGAFATPIREEISECFLSKASKKSAANPDPITGAKLLLRWQSEELDEATLNRELTHDKTEEKVKYLPQRFVETLCAPENTRQLQDEIERVIFQRIDRTDRLDASDFQELRQAATKSIQLRRGQLVRTIGVLNQTIADTSSRIALRPAKEQELKRKKAELAAMLKTAPEVPKESQAELKRLGELNKTRQELESKITKHSEELAAVDAIETKFNILRGELTSFNEEIVTLAKTAGITIDDQFRVSVSDTVQERLVIRRQEIAKAIEVLRDGGGGKPSAACLRSVNMQIAEITAKSKLAETKRREQDKFLKDKKRLDDTILALGREIKEIDEALVPRRKAEYEARIERYLDGIELLEEERKVYEELYQPLKTALEASDEIARKLSFVSGFAFDSSRHTSRCFELLHKRKAIYKEPDDLEISLKKFFSDLSQNTSNRAVLQAAVKDLYDSFMTLADGKKIGIQEQLRSAYTSKDFADWFFGLEPFSVVYSIKFDGKELQLLSPGEKGMVLLLLYLEAETEDTRPLIIDQPDDNLDNVSVYPSLVEYFRTRKKTRQVIIITHNPNLVVNTDSEQVFVASFDGARTPKLVYRCGALEDTHPTATVVGIREDVCKVLEGGSKAFQLRERRYDLG